MSGLGQSRNLFLQGNNSLRWTELVNWLVISHLAAEYKRRCLHKYRWPDWFSLIWGIYVISLTSGYRSKVDYTRQHWGQHYSTDSRPGQWEQKLCEHFRCFRTVVFVVLIKYGRRISWVTKKLGIRYWILVSSLRNSHWMRLGWGGWDMFCACLQNAYLVVLCCSR